MLNVWNFQLKNSKICKSKSQKSVITDELKLYHTKYISSKSNTKLSMVVKIVKLDKLDISC